MAGNRQARFAAADALGAVEEREQANEALTPEFVNRKLDLQQSLAEAQKQEVLAITNYQIALSQLEFNSRVLALAEDTSRLLLERVRFLAIFGRNLDEFFQVRVGGLMTQRQAGFDAREAIGKAARDHVVRDMRRVFLVMAERRQRIFGGGRAMRVGRRPDRRIADRSGVER